MKERLTEAYVNKNGCTLYCRKEDTIKNQQLIDKLAYYENLEELASFLSDGKISIEDILERLKKTIQGEEKELKFSRILTNAEAEKWDKWKSLEAKCLESTGLDFENMVGEFMHYYGLQRQDRLIELPCAVGDTIYYLLGIPNKTPCEIEETKFYLSDLNRIGKDLFLTKAEAEAALKRAEQEASTTRLLNSRA